MHALRALKKCPVFLHFFNGQSTTELRCSPRGSGKPRHRVHSPGSGSLPTTLRVVYRSKTDEMTVKGILEVVAGVLGAVAVIVSTAWYFYDLDRRVRDLEK